MEPSFELVSFVTRSANRVEVLRTLRTGPRTRPDLQAETDIPRATLSRVLADFRDRDLVARDGYEYRMTPLGDRLAAGLESLFESVGEMRSLQTVAQWLPLEALDVDLAALSDVRVTHPTQIDPMRPVKRAAEVVGDSSHVRAFCYSVIHAPILAEVRAVTQEGQRFEVVVAAGVLDAVAADPNLAGPARELFQTGTVEASVHDGDVEPQLIIADGTTMFLVTDDDGAIQGLVEIGDTDVLPWARRTFESFREAATPLDPDRVDDLLTT